MAERSRHETVLRHRRSSSLIRMPILVFIASQLLASGVLFLIVRLVMKFSDLGPNLLALAFGQGLIAAVIGTVFGLAWWWVPLQILLPPAAVTAIGIGVPAWAYGAVFVLLLLVFWNTARDQVPLFLSNSATHKAVADYLPAGTPLRIIDLGCGMGGTVLALAKALPSATVHGVETAPLLFLVAWLRVTIFGPKNAQVSYRNMWKVQLSGYDVAYCFLSSTPMRELYAKARGEMAPGSLFVSNSFVVPNVTPTDIIDVPDQRQTKLYVWRK